MAKSFTLGVAIVGSLGAQDSPLERLEKRSADSRWEQAKKHWLDVDPSKVADAPKPEVSQPAPVASEKVSIPDEVFGKSTPVFIQPIPENKSPMSLPVPLFDPAAEQLSNTPQPEQVPAPVPGRVQLSETMSPMVAAESIPSGTFSGIEAARSVADVGVSDPIAEIPLPPVNVEIAVPDPYPASEYLSPAVPVQETFTVALPPLPENSTTGNIRLSQASSDDLIGPDAKQLIHLSISDIQPYHDYVPRSSRSDGQTKAATPAYLELPEQGSLQRDVAPTYYHWMASNLTHDPLYFEDVSLERYGHTFPNGLQPLFSVGKFGLQLAGLPYQIALDPVWCEQYPLGYYRPGDCAPPLRYRIPWNRRAAATAAGVYTGLFFLIP